MPIIVRSERRNVPQETPQPDWGGNAMSAPGRALAGLGNAIAGLASSIKDANNFDTKLKTTEFLNNERLALDKYDFEYQGDGADYYATWEGGYTQRRQQFVKQLPDGDAKQAAILATERARGQFGATALNRSQNKIRAHAVTSTLAVFDRAAANVQGLGDIPGLTQQADAIIAGVPGINETQREKLREHVAKGVLNRVGQLVQEGKITPDEAEAFVKSQQAEKEKKDAEQPKVPDLTGVLTSGKSNRAAYGWARSNATWQRLGPFERAAAMSLMEADGRNIDDARNALGAMINRAAKGGEDLGAHVSQKIYQPTWEGNQEKRLESILKSSQFKELVGWAERRAKGLEADPVNGATHFLASEKTMLALEAGNPSKYRSWRKWTNFDPSTSQYRGVITRDRSHAFLAPEGVANFPGRSSSLDTAGAMSRAIGDYGQSLLDVANKVRTQQQQMAYIRGVSSGAVEHNPRNADANKLLNSFVKGAGFREKIFAGDGEAITQAVQLSLRANVVPEAIEQGFEGLLGSRDPKLRVAGYTALSVIRDKNPGLVTGDTAKKIDTYRTMREMGRTDEQIFEFMDERARPEWKMKHEGRAKVAAELLKKLDVKDIRSQFADGSIPDWFTRPKTDVMSANARLQFETTYRKAFEEHFTRWGDEEMAKKLAAKEMTAVYGRTEVMGQKTIMRLPPEAPQFQRWHPPINTGKGPSLEWFKDQVIREAKQGFPGMDVEPDSIELMADSRTMQEAGSGQQPTYVVIGRTKDGSPLVSSALGWRFKADADEVKAKAKEMFDAQREQKMKNQDEQKAREESRKANPAEHYLKRGNELAAEKEKKAKENAARAQENMPDFAGPQAP